MVVNSAPRELALWLSSICQIFINIYCNESNSKASNVMVASAPVVIMVTVFVVVLTVEIVVVRTAINSSSNIMDRKFCSGWRRELVVTIVVQ